MKAIPRISINYGAKQKFDETTKNVTDGIKVAIFRTVCVGVLSQLSFVYERHLTVGLARRDTVSEKNVILFSSF